MTGTCMIGIVTFERSVGLAQSQYSRLGLYKPNMHPITRVLVHVAYCTSVR